MEFEPPDAMQDKIKQLTEAVQGLTSEVKRLQTNMEQMHRLQATLLQVTQQLMQWAEKFESRDSKRTNIVEVNVSARAEVSNNSTALEQ